MSEYPSKSFRELLVWQKAHALALAVYRLTRGFPSHELYALTSQLRRSASSVPANIVEGYRRRTTPDKLRFYYMAHASADECLYHLILAPDLGYGDTAALQTDTDEVNRLLHGYVAGIERNHP